MDSPGPSRPQHAGVHVPPPLIYVAGFVVGWLIERRWPLPITHGDSVVRDVLGLLLVAADVAIFVSAFTTFRRLRTTIIPNQPATALATEGAYGYTRNPMYVGLIALYIGLALFVNSWWTIVLLPVVVVVIDRAVIAREARYLSAAFPEQYAAYCGLVRRWL